MVRPFRRDRRRLAASDWSCSPFRRTGFVTVVSAEEQRAVDIPLELLRPEHSLLQEPPEVGWLDGMDTVARLRRELDALGEVADEHHRAVIEEAADLVDYSLGSGRAFIAVVRGDGPEA